MELTPKKGALAYCSLNRLGLITSETAVPVVYNDGNEGISWVGIQLTDGQVQGIGGDKGKIINQKVGDPWMSKHPRVIAYLDDIEPLIAVAERLYIDVFWTSNDLPIDEQVQMWEDLRKTLNLPLGLDKEYKGEDNGSKNNS